MRRLFLLVAAVVLVDTMFFAAVAPLLPHYSDELGLSKSAAGVLAAAYPAGTLVGALPAGWLAARVGVKPTVLLGLALLTITSLVFGFAQSVLLLDLARFAQGVGGACSWAGGLAWLVSASPADQRGTVIGSALGAAIVGVLLGPALGGLATLLSPEIVFSGVAVLAAGLAAWAWSDARDPRRAECRDAGRGTGATEPTGDRGVLALHPPGDLRRRAGGARAHCGWTSSAPRARSSAASSWWSRARRPC